MSNSILAGVMADEGFVAGVEELGSMDAVVAWQDGVDLGSAEVEMETAVAAVEVTDTWVGGVESLIEYMEQNVESGMSAGAAEVVAMSMDHLMAQAGIERKIVAGVESFQGESAAQAATVAGIEEGDNFLKKVWQSIKNAVYRAITAIRNFFAKLFGGWKKMAVLVSKQLEKVQKLDSGFVSKKVEVKNAQHLHVNGSLKPADITQGFQTAAKGAKQDDVGTVIDLYKKMLQEAAKKLETLKSAETFGSADELKKAKEEKEKIEKEWAESKKDLPGGITAKFKAVDEEGAKKLAAGKTEDEATAYFEKYFAYMVSPKIEIVSSEKSSIKATKELDEFNKDQIASICLSLNEICSGAVQKDSTIRQLNDTRKSFVDAIDILIIEADKGKLGSLWDKGKIRWLSRQAGRDLTKPINKYFQKMFSSVRAGYSLINDAI